MSKGTTRSGNERLKYGICLNDECSMCKSKEVQSVPMRKELLCTECGKELRECPPPKKKSKLPLVVIAVLVVIGAVVGCIFVFPSGSTEEIEQPKTENIAVVETPQVEEAPTQEEKPEERPVEKPVENPNVQPEATSQDNGTLRLSYGTYTGATKDGYPHGQGRLTYSTARQIHRNDMKGRKANAGDYVIGEFFNGFVVYGKHYDSAGNLLQSLNFGIGSESSYESK